MPALKATIITTTEIIIVIPARIAAACGLSLSFAALPAHAQLPAPSRTIYKCEVGGKVTYGDQPCLGAQRLDVVVPRGVSKLSGRERSGTDVANERRREELARALQPLTGMDEQKFATATRRHNLSAAAKRECRALEAAILDNEQAEQRSGARGVMEALQHDLLILRKRYRELNC